MYGFPKYIASPTEEDMEPEFIAQSNIDGRIFWFLTSFDGITWLIYLPETRQFSTFEIIGPVY